uniref:Uncharacterized protein n=1 Tax=Oryza rufipogon TaxID=4529 RepID=A0A0E0Q294_ORYRU
MSATSRLVKPAVDWMRGTELLIIMTRQGIPALMPPDMSSGRGGLAAIPSIHHPVADRSQAFEIGLAHLLIDTNANGYNIGLKTMSKVLHLKWTMPKSNWVNP